ncbi:MAG: alpha/beta fold hydrolase [Chloroflexi bacterium]|nr:alpha/beta fold hydrolase [Chloroflexota bacterium]
MPLVQCGEIKIEYHIEGDGPPLLMLRGLGGQASTWGEPLLSGLRDNFTVIRMNHRGVGLSELPNEPFTMQTMAADAATLLEALDIDRAHVLSVSMGGMVAQELVLNHPESVNGLILGCTLPGGPNAVIASPEITVLLLPDQSLSRADQARRSWGAITTQAMIDDGVFLEEMLRIGLEVPTPPEVIGQQVAAVQGFDAYDRLPSIKHPTLIIHGDADILVPAENGRILHERIPGSTLEIIPGGAHMFFWEQPVLTARIVVDFLTSVGSREIVKAPKR